MSTIPNFKLELKKIIRSKKIILTILVSLLISSSIFYWNHTNLDRYGQDLFSSMFHVNLEVRSTRMEYEKRMREVELSFDEIRFHMTLYTEMENEMNRLNSISHYDYRYEIPSQMVAFYEAYQKYAEDRAENANGRQFFHLYDGNYERIEAEKAFFQELLDRGLPYEDPVYPLYGANFVKSVMNLAFGMVLALLVLLLLVDIFSEEKVNGTEKVRLIQPVKRINILLSKLFASLGYILFFLVFTCVMSYILAGLFGSGFGSFHYPVQSYYGLESTGVSVGEYVGLGILYYSLYLLFIISCLALLTAIVKETSIVAVIGILLIIIGDTGVVKNWRDLSIVYENLPIIGNIPVVEPFNYLNPFSYLYFDAFIFGIDKNNPLIMTGFILLISIVLMLLTHHLTKTTWIQNFTLTSKGKGGEGALLKYEQQRPLPLPYFRFEVLKVIKKTTTTIPFIFLLILVVVYGLGENNRYEEQRTRAISAHQNSAYYQEELIAMNEQLIAEEDLEPERLKGTEDALDNYYAQYNHHVNAVEAYKSGELGGILAAQKYWFEYYSEIVSGGYPVEAREVYLAQLEEIKERQVQPIISPSAGMVWRIEATSPFAKGSNLRSNWEYPVSQPSITYFFNSLFKDRFSVLLLGIVALSLAAGFSDETHDTRTMYLLNTQPMKRKRIYLGKLFAQSVVFLTMVMILVGTLFIGLRLSGSPMEGNFPAVQYKNQIDADYTGVTINRRALTDNRGKQISTRAANKLMGFSFRNMSLENTEMVAMLVLSGLVMIAFAMLISLKIPNKIGVSLGTFLIFGLGYLASRYILKGIGIMLPFIWLNQPLVASGEASMIFNVNLLNSILGMLVLSLWLATLVYFGYRKFSKEYGRG